MKIKSFQLIWAATTLVVSTAVIVSVSDSRALAQASASATLEKIQPNAEMLKTGEKIFQANCTACHGTEGKGDGLSAAALNPPPRNFHTKDGWKNGLSFAGMYKTLEEGLAGGAMGAYTQFSAQERVALINYIRDLKIDNYPKITVSEIEKLEKDYDFSKELSKKVEKNILPIDVAMQKLVTENAASVKKVLMAREKVMAANDADAIFLREATYDLRRALTMLNNSSVWKGSTADFGKTVMSSLGHNGFKSTVGSFSSDDWQKLHSYLKNIL